MGNKVLRALVLAAALAAAAAAGCGWLGSSPAPEPGVWRPEGPPPTVPLLEYELPATATPWPTFTPVPTAAAVPDAGDESPEATLVSERRPPEAAPPAAEPELPEVQRIERVRPGESVEPAGELPEIRRGTPNPEETSVGGESLAVEDVVEDEDSFSVYGKLPGLPVYFQRQKLFVSDRAELLPSIMDGDFSAIGPALKKVPSRARFVFWAAEWAPELAEGESFEYRGWVRLTGFLPDGRLRFVYPGDDQVLNNHQTYLVTGWGQASGFFWQPGRYTVEFLSSETEEVIVEWEFDVYR